MSKKKTIDVVIEITCHDVDEVVKAREAVLYHLETLGPEFSYDENKLTVRVQPLDLTLFELDEGVEIIRQTLQQSLTFVEHFYVYYTEVNQ